MTRRPRAPELRIAVLVTGSRDWTDVGAVIAALKPLADHLHFAQRRATLVLIHGDNGDEDEHGHAVRGLDIIARDVARELGFSAVIPMPAPFAREGAKAGPMRNRGMLTILRWLRWAGWECHVLAFPLGDNQRSGTRDCMAQARAAGFEVVEHRP